MPPPYFRQFPITDLVRVRYDEACRVALRNGVSRSTACHWIFLRYLLQRGVILG